MLEINRLPSSCPLNFVSISRTQTAFMAKPQQGRDAATDGDQEDIDLEEFFCSSSIDTTGFNLGAWDTSKSTSSTVKNHTNTATQDANQEQTLPQHELLRRSARRNYSLDDKQDDGTENDDSDNANDWEQDRPRSTTGNTSTNKERCGDNFGSCIRRVRFHKCPVTQIIEYPKPSPEEGYLLHYSGQELQQFILEYTEERKNMSLLERLDC